MDRNFNYSFFNIMRFFCSISIALFCHYAEWFIYYMDTYNHFAEFPALAVLTGQSNHFTELFFIISGILFIHVYLPRIIAGKTSLDSFFKGRFFRLFPMIILSSLVLYLIQILLINFGFEPWYASLDIVTLFYDFLFGSGVVFMPDAFVNGPIWYLGTLMFVYLLAYGTALLYKKYPNKMIFFIMIFVGVCFINFDADLPVINYRVGRGITAFFEGCLIEFFLQSVPSFSKKKKTWLAVAAGIMFMIALVYLGLYLSGKDEFLANLDLFYDFCVYPPFIYLCFICKPLNKLSNTKFVKWLGNISYGIYLWNFTVFSFTFFLLRMQNFGADWLNQNWIKVWLLMLAGHIGLSALSYQFYEKPVADYAKKHWMQEKKA